MKCSFAKGCSFGAVERGLCRTHLRAHDVPLGSAGPTEGYVVSVRGVEVRCTTLDDLESLLASPLVEAQPAQLRQRQQIQAPEPEVRAGGVTRVDIRFGNCWRAPKSFGGCKNKTPILPSGKPATVCHEHAVGATRDRWKFLEKKHKQSTIFPFPNMTVDALGLSTSSKKYGWGKDSHGKERKSRSVKLGGIRRPQGRPAKSVYGKRRAKTPEPEQVVFPGKPTGNISSDLPAAILEDRVPVDISEKSPGNISAKTARNIPPVSAPETSAGLVEQKPAEVSGLGPVFMADALPVQVRWLWKHRIPSAMLTVIFAPPGVGKGTLMAAIAAAVTSGNTLPEDEQGRVAGNVLFVVAEDSLNLTLRPRLDAAGADISRVRAFGPERQIAFPRDLRLVEAAARDCALVVVDPLRALTNGDSRTKVRTTLTALEGVAARTGAAVVVVHHSAKANEASPLGSQDIVGIPRSVLRVEVYGDGRRVVHQQKKNLAPEARPAYFRIVDLDGVGFVEWEPADTEPFTPLYKKADKTADGLVLQIVPPASPAAEKVEVSEDVVAGLDPALPDDPVPAVADQVDAEPALQEVEEDANDEPEELAYDTDLDDEEPIIELQGSPVFRPARPPKQPVPIPDVSKMKLSDKQLTWAAAAKQGNELAAKLLLDSVENLILKVANRTVFHARALGTLGDEDMLDIYATVKAKLYAKIPDFDSTKAGWVTYAVNWIKQTSRRWLQDHGRTVRVPVHIFHWRSVVSKARTALTASLGRNPTDEELRDATGVTPKTLAGVRSLMHNIAALDAPLKTDSETTRLDMLPAESHEETALEALLKDEEAGEARQLLATLDSKERFILEHRFGIGGDEPLTLAQIGEKLGVSRERVRQIETVAIAKLRGRAGNMSQAKVREAQERYTGTQRRKASRARTLPKYVYEAHGSPGRFVANPYVDGVMVRLGTFGSIEEAEAAIARMSKDK